MTEFFISLILGINIARLIYDADVIADLKCRIAELQSQITKLTRKVGK